MEFVAVKWLTAAVLPPGIFILGLVGALLIRSRRASRILLVTLLVTLALASNGYVADKILRGLDRYPPLTPEQVSGAQAIVILASERRAGLAPNGRDAAGPSTLERVRHGAMLARQTGLPVLVSGGAPEGTGVPLAQLMAEAMAEYGVSVRWREGQSWTTAQNGRFSARILRQAGIGKIVLVTHYWHLPRAVPIFESAGLRVYPSPVALSVYRDVPNLRPSVQALAVTTAALHEYLGLIWYRVRYGAAGQVASMASSR